MKHIFHFWVDWRLDNPLNCEVEKKSGAKTDAKIVLEGFLESELKKRGREAGGFNIKGWDACPMNPTRKVKQLCFTHHHNSLWGDNTQSQTNISLFYLPIILILECDCRRLEWYWRVILLKHHLAKSPFQLIKLKSVTSSFLWSFTLRIENTNSPLEQ